MLNVRGLVEQAEINAIAAQYLRFKTLMVWIIEKSSDSHSQQGAHRCRWIAREQKAFAGFSLYAKIIQNCKRGPVVRNDVQGSFFVKKSIAAILFLSQAEDAVNLTGPYFLFKHCFGLLQRCTPRVYHPQLLHAISTASHALCLLFLRHLFIAALSVARLYL